MKVTRENASLLIFYFFPGNNIFVSDTFSKNIKGCPKFSRVLLRFFYRLKFHFTNRKLIYLMSTFYCFFFLFTEVCSKWVGFLFIFYRKKLSFTGCQKYFLREGSSYRKQKTHFFYGLKFCFSLKKTLESGCQKVPQYHQYFKVILLNYLNKRFKFTVLQRKSSSNKRFT